MQVEPTAALFDEISNGFSLVVSHFQDIAEAVQDHLHHLGILHREQVAEWRDDLLIDQMCHLNAPQVRILN